jgi:hypothetical protein
MDQGERREHNRLELDLPARIEGPTGMLAATVVNLGEQGARLLTTSATGVGRGDEVLIDLHLPGEDKALRALGWVADAARRGTGDALSVTFFGLPEDDALRVRALVSAAGVSTAS